MENTKSLPYDALLLVSFGGPECRQDVIPFLENVLRGKNVPRQRLLEVAEHYYHFDGVSPINAHNRALIQALERELAENGPPLPIYWGNRNWHPLLTDTIEQMKRDQIQRSLALATSAFSSYSGCRQYLEDIERARAAVNDAPQIDKLRVFYNHPGFIEPMREHLRAAIEQFPLERRRQIEIIFTAHSIPQAMSRGCDYVEQLRESCQLVSVAAGAPWRLAYQSRSGPPSQPWLEPDVCDVVREFHVQRKSTDVVDVIIVPIGFLSDHMEVLYDLDVEARQLCDELEINMVRAATVGDHPRFIHMIGELIRERTSGAEKLYLGRYGPAHDVCPANCCPSGRPTRP